MVPSTNIFMVPCFHRWTVQQLRMRSQSSLPVFRIHHNWLWLLHTIQCGAVTVWSWKFQCQIKIPEHNAEKKVEEKIISRSSLYLWYHVSIYLSCITKQNTSKMPSEAARTNRLLDWGWWTVTHQLHLLPPGRPLDFPTHSCGMASSPPSILCPCSAAAG